MGTIVGVVGTGNMGAALVRGWLRASDSDVSFLVYDVIPERVDELALDDRVRAAASVEDLAREAQVILLVVKPKDTGKVLERMRPYFDEGKIVVSSAAGVAIDSVRSDAGNAPSVFRIMPNLGVELGQGVVAVATETTTKAEVTARVLELLAPLGLVELVTEDLFDAITAVSGSSIAFLALALEGLEDGAVRAGLPQGHGSGFRPPDGSGRLSPAAASSRVGRRHQGPGFVPGGDYHRRSRRARGCRCARGVPAGRGRGCGTFSCHARRRAAPRT